MSHVGMLPFTVSRIAYWCFRATCGILLFEIGLGQERQVKTLLERNNAYESISLVTNETGEGRVVMAYAKKQEELSTSWR